MTTLSEEKAQKLREPFPKVQKVTKEWTDKKTGERRSVTLDYISHAVVTDRLLSVDPAFTFEPLIDHDGRPCVTPTGLSLGDSIGVWGRLTLLGTTTIEFASGRDLLDAYSRCLCRAAMRRGVALDLWIRDDEFKAQPTHVDNSSDAFIAVGESYRIEGSGVRALATAAQLRKLHATIGELVKAGHDRYAIRDRILAHFGVASTKELTRKEAAEVIDGLSVGGWT